MTEAQCKGGRAIMVSHDMFDGERRWPVRSFQVFERENHGDEYGSAVAIEYVAKGRRQPEFIWLTETGTIRPNSAFLTIETEAGEVLYDTRTDVPCDMEEWQKTLDFAEQLRREINAVINGDPSLEELMALTTRLNALEISRRPLPDGELYGFHGPIWRHTDALSGQVKGIGEILLEVARGSPPPETVKTAYRWIDAWHALDEAIEGLRFPFRKTAQVTAQQR